MSKKWKGEEIVDIDLWVGVRPRKKRRQTRRTKVTVQQMYATAPTAEMDTDISSSRPAGTSILSSEWRPLIGQDSSRYCALIG